MNLLFVALVCVVLCSATVYCVWLGIRRVRQSWHEFREHKESPEPPVCAAPEEDYGKVYRIGFVITWVLTFFISWIACTASYGFLLGFGLGWLPSAILATIVAALWPLLLLIIAVLIWYGLKH